MQLLFNYINYGSIDFIDEFGKKSGDNLNPMSFNPSFSAAIQLKRKFRVGATLKMPFEYLGDYENSQMAMGWGADLGVQYQPSLKRVRFGVSLLNFRKKRARPIFYCERCWASSLGT